MVQMSIDDSIDSNKKRIKHFIEQAALRGVRLVAFPEMALTGFNSQVLCDPELSRLVEAALGELEDSVERLSVGAIVGHALSEEGSLYNAATAMLPGGNRYVYRKIHLTEEERPYFRAGREAGTFELDGGRFGVMICRDQNDPFLARRIADLGASALFILSAHLYSPAEARWKLDKNRALPIARAVENSVFVLLSNAVGSHISRVSLGNSMIVDPKGALVCVAGEESEELLYHELS